MTRHWLGSAPAEKAQIYTSELVRMGLFHFPDSRRIAYLLLDFAEL